MKIILVLGSPNSDDGALSKMAQSRLEVCLRLYLGSNLKIVLTGGFGGHFNVTDKAHAMYLKKYLIEKGVEDQHILGIVESANSVEDATLSKWILDKFQPEQVLIVTSDYHYLRARLIFETVYAPYTAIDFHLASSSEVDQKVLFNLIAHEKIALQGLIDLDVQF